MTLWSSRCICLCVCLSVSIRIILAALLWVMCVCVVCVVGASDGLYIPGARIPLSLSFLSFVQTTVRQAACGFCVAEATDFCVLCGCVGGFYRV